MKPINFFLALLLLIMTNSCDKSDPIEVPNEPLTAFEILLNEYGIFNTQVKFENAALGSDTTLIYFNGRDDSKFHVVCFERDNKSKLFSWTEDTQLDTVLVVDEGYGISGTHIIKEFRLEPPYKHQNEYILILNGMALGSQYLMGQRIISSDLYFISNSHYVKYKSLTYPIGNYFYTGIASWYQNSVIITTSSDSRPPKFSCYSTKGGLLFEFNDYYELNDFDKNYWGRNEIDKKNKYFPISFEEIIFFSPKPDGDFIYKNIKSNSIKWYISTDSSVALPENTRIDMIDVLKESEDIISFDYQYTLISGEKSSVKIKINIETGIIL